MDRYARRQHFERLITLRDRYADLGPDDTVWIMTIEDAIAWATDELEADDVAQFVAEDRRADAA
jgi:hypothetical protein